MAKKTPLEVEILGERVLEIFRGDQPPHHQIAITYQQAGVPLPRTVWVLAEDVFEEKTEDFLKQHAAREGPLYTKWLEFRAQKIREDIERERAFKPERVTV